MAAIGWNENFVLFSYQNPAQTLLRAIHHCLNYPFFAM
jgi:hypothetical protein